MQLHTRNCKRKKNNIYFASKWDKWVQASELNWNLNFESWKDIKNSDENNVYCLRTVCKRLGVSECQEHKSLSFNKCKRVFLKSKYLTKQIFKTAISFLAPHPQGQQIRISLKLNGQWALQKEEIALCHDHQAPNSMRFEVSKKVLLVQVPQGAEKLQAVKVLVIRKIKSGHRWRCFHMKIWKIKSHLFPKFLHRIFFIFLLGFNTN